MSLELLNSFATIGTFLVITATALVAIVQLRQLRGSNMIAALYKVRETSESQELRDAQHFVFTELDEKMKDPAFRYQMARRAARTNENRESIAKIIMVGNFWESVGTLVKTGLLDKNLVFEAWSGHVVDDWNKLAPATALWRRMRGSASMENFEYLTVLSQDYEAAHPTGTYPTGMRRIDLKDDWLQADTQYAASIATA
jgi:hypothetical protein